MSISCLNLVKYVPLLEPALTQGDAFKVDTRLLKERIAVVAALSFAIIGLLYKRASMPFFLIGAFCFTVITGVIGYLDAKKTLEFVNLGKSAREHFNLGKANELVNVDRFVELLLQPNSLYSYVRKGIITNGMINERSQHEILLSLTDQRIDLDKVFDILVNQLHFDVTATNGAKVTVIGRLVGIGAEVKGDVSKMPKNSSSQRIEEVKEKIRSKGGYSMMKLGIGS